MADRVPAPSTDRVCTICGDAEPHHVHDGDRRIEDYFLVGRGQTEFQAAQSWQAKYRAARAEGRREAVREAKKRLQPYVDRSEEIHYVAANIAYMDAMEILDEVAGLNASESPTPMHDSSDHDCRGGVEGDRYPFTGDANESPDPEAGS